MYEEITKAIESATPDKQKQAMFLYQVLSHAAELTDVDPVKFCLAVGMTEGDKADFYKMLALHRLMQGKGLRLP